MQSQDIERLIGDARSFAAPIFGRHYSSCPDALRIVDIHSSCVARKALSIALRKFPEMDMEFLAQAAMLHDIGGVGCDAPSIHCHGSEPYIRHGIIGRDMLLLENLPRHASVCARHTGAGLTKEEIAAMRLPLPHEDFLPLTREERLICYADKFYSKSATPEKEKSLERIYASLGKFGEAPLGRFRGMDKMSNFAVTE